MGTPEDGLGRKSIAWILRKLYYRTSTLLLLSRETGGVKRKMSEQEYGDKPAEKTTADAVRRAAVRGGI